MLSLKVDLPLKRPEKSVILDTSQSLIVGPSVVSAPPLEIQLAMAVSSSALSLINPVGEELGIELVELEQEDMFVLCNRGSM